MFEEKQIDTQITRIVQNLTDMYFYVSICPIGLICFSTNCLATCSLNRVTCTLRLAT